MSLPKVEIVFIFLNDYPISRVPLWESNKEKAVNLMKQAYNSLPSLPNVPQSLSFLKNMAPAKLQTNEEAKREVCDNFMEAFINAKDYEDWINITLDLGKYARQILQEDPKSLLGLRLHAIRTLIIAHIKKDESYTKKIKELRDKMLKLDDTIYPHYLDGLDISLLETQQQTCLYQLADLGDDRAIFECKRLSLFDPQSYPEKQSSHGLEHSQNLVDHSKININKPAYYQAEYYFHHQKDHAMPKNRKPGEEEKSENPPKESFEDFKKRALVEYEAAKQAFLQRRKAPHLELIATDEGPKGLGSGLRPIDPPPPPSGSSGSAPSSSAVPPPSIDTTAPGEGEKIVPPSDKPKPQEGNGSPKASSSFDPNTNLFSPLPAIEAEKRKEEEEKKKKELEAAQEQNKGKVRGNKGKSSGK